MGFFFFPSSDQINLTTPYSTKHKCDFSVTGASSSYCSLWHMAVNYSSSLLLWKTNICSNASRPVSQRGKVANDTDLKTLQNTRDLLDGDQINQHHTKSYGTGLQVTDTCLCEKSPAL